MHTHIHSNPSSRRKYLVTGGAGFIGSNIVRYLVAKGCSVINVDDLSSGKKFNLLKNKYVKNILKPIQSINDLNIFEGIHGIFHLAAQSSVPYSLEYFFNSSKNNLVSSLKIWDVADKLNTPIVYASSSAIYGDLEMGDENSRKSDILSPYALDKLTIEEYANILFKIKNISSFGLRFFNVYGPRQDPTNPYSGVISIFIDRLIRDKVVTINGGHQTRDFVYVDDVAKVMYNAMTHLNSSPGSTVMNVGTGSTITIDNLLKKLASILNVKPKVKYADLPDGDPERSDGNYTKLKKLFNMTKNEMVSISDGLKLTVEHEVKKSL